MASRQAGERKRNSASAHRRDESCCGTGWGRAMEAGSLLRSTAVDIGRAVGGASPEQNGPRQPWPGDTGSAGQCPQGTVGVAAPIAFQALCRTRATRDAQPGATWSVSELNAVRKTLGNPRGTTGCADRWLIRKTSCRQQPASTLAGTQNGSTIPTARSAALRQLQEIVARRFMRIGCHPKNKTQYLIVNHHAAANKGKV